MMVKRFYDRNQEPVVFDQDEVDWTIKKDRFGRALFGIELNEKDIPLSYTANLTTLMLFSSSIHLTHFKTSMVLRP